jgi:hypothetical protein
MAALVLFILPFFFVFESVGTLSYFKFLPSLLYE